MDFPVKNAIKASTEQFCNSLTISYLTHSEAISM